MSEPVVQVSFEIAEREAVRGANGFREVVGFARGVSWRAVQGFPDGSGVDGEVVWRAAGAKDGDVGVAIGWGGEEKVTEEEISSGGIVASKWGGSMERSRWRFCTGVAGGSDGAMMTNVDSFSGTGVSGHDISVGLGKSKYWNEGVVTTLREW